jgi:hypothetical protein
MESKNRQFRSQQGPRPVPRRFYGEITADLQFTEEGGRMVAFVDGTVVYPGTYGDFRFEPKPVVDSSQVNERTYRCSIKNGFALPEFPERLVESGEWRRIKLPVAKLTFRWEDGRMICRRNDGKIALVDTQCENDLVEDEQTEVWLMERHNAFIAFPCVAHRPSPQPRQQQQRPQQPVVPKGSAAVPVDVKERSVVHPDDQTLVCKRVYGVRDGKPCLTSPADLVIRHRVCGIYAMLTDPQLDIKITKASSELEIIDAAERIALAASKFSEQEKSIAGMNARAILDALCEAKKRALALLARGAADVPATDGGQTVQAGDRPAKHRQRGGRGRRGENSAQQTTAAPAQAEAPVESAQPSGASDDVADVLAETVPATPVVVEKAAPTSAPEPVAAAAPVEKPVVVPAAAAPVAEETPDAVTLAIRANDPGLAKIKKYLGASWPEVEAGVRLAIAQKKCEDVKMFVNMDLEMHRYYVRTAKARAKSGHQQGSSSSSMTNGAGITAR